MKDTSIETFVKSTDTYKKYHELYMKNEIDFNTYWDKISPYYNKCYIEQIKENNYLFYFKNLFRDRIFFERIHKYMISVNWNWGVVNQPSIYNLKSCCLELFQNVMFEDSVDNYCSSGGFKVGFYNKNLIIQFKERGFSDNILFEKIISLNDIRKIKLEKINE